MLVFLGFFFLETNSVIAASGISCGGCGSLTNWALHGCGPSGDVACQCDANNYWTIRQNCKDLGQFCFEGYCTTKDPNCVADEIICYEQWQFLGKKCSQCCNGFYHIGDNINDYYKCGTVPTLIPTIVAPTSVPTVTVMPDLTITVAPAIPTFTGMLTPTTIPGLTIIPTATNTPILPSNTPTVAPTPTSVISPIATVNRASLYCDAEGMGVNSNHPALATALGCVPIQVEDFIGWLFPYLFGVTGAIAFLRMVGGFLKISTANGELANIEEGKKMVTAAMIGLLISIFSIFIIRLIVIGVLKFPGT